MKLLQERNEKHNRFFNIIHSMHCACNNLYMSLDAHKFMCVCWYIEMIVGDYCYQWKCQAS
jgi:hypothetical protein